MPVLKSTSTTTTNNKGLRYGHRVMLRTTAHQLLLSTHSAIAPLGARHDETESDNRPGWNAAAQQQQCASAGSIPVESALFTLISGEAEFHPSQLDSVGGEIRFGQTVRIVHNARRLSVVHLANERSVMERNAQRVTLEPSSVAHDTQRSSSSYSPSTGSHHASAQLQSAEMRSDRWRVLPKYKLRGEGEKICDGDVVVFQSTVASSAYLSVSSECDVRSDFAFEAHCNGVCTGFQVQIYDDADVSEQVLRAGQCVTLLHRESNRRLLAASATTTTNSAASTSQPEICLETQLSHTVDPFAKFTAGIGNLFVVECADKSQGGCLYARSSLAHYRLRSLATGKYIGAVYNGDTSNGVELTLVAKDGSPNDRAGVVSSLICFDPAGEHDPASPLSNGSRVFLSIEMHQSNSDGAAMWVAADRHQPQAPRSLGQPSPEVADPLKVALLSLALRKTKSIGDGFEIQRMPPHEFSELSAVISLLPPLHAASAALADGSIATALLLQAVGNVRSLRARCFQSGTMVAETDVDVDGVIDRSGQMRLYRQGVADVAIRLVRGCLTCPFVSANPSALGSDESFTHPASGEEVSFQAIADLLRVALSLLQNIIKDNATIIFSLREVIPYLTECCFLFPQMCLCVAEFIRGGGEDFLDGICDSGLGDVCRFLDLLEARPRDPAVLHLLSLFAACRDRGVERIQHCIGVRHFGAAPMHSVSGAVTAPSCEAYREHYFQVRAAPSNAIELSVPTSMLPSKVWKAFADKQACAEDLLSGSANSAMPMMPATVWVPLQHLVLVSKKSKPKGALLLYMTEAVRLLASLCAGRNRQWLPHIFFLFPPHVLTALVTRSDVPAALHAMMIILFSNALVACQCSVSMMSCVLTRLRVAVDENYRVVNKDQLLEMQRLVKRHDSRSGVGALCSDEDTRVLQAAKDYAERYLVSLAGAMSSDDGKRQEIDAVVRLTASLLDSGALTVRDMCTLALPLIECLDNRNDDAVNDPEVFADKTTIVQLLDNIAEALLASCACRILIEAFSLIAGDSSLVEMEARLGEAVAHTVLRMPPFFPFDSVDDVLQYAVAGLKRNAGDDGDRHHDARDVSTAYATAASSSRVSAQLFDVLMVISTANNWSLSSLAIQFFCKVGGFRKCLAEKLSGIFLCFATDVEVLDASQAHMEQLILFSKTRSNAKECIEALNSALAGVSGLAAAAAPPRQTTAPLRHRRSVFANIGASSPSQQGDGVDAHAAALLQPHVVYDYFVHSRLFLVLLKILSDANAVRQRSSQRDVHEICEASIRLLTVVAAHDPGTLVHVAEAFPDALNYFSKTHTKLFLELVVLCFASAERAHLLTQETADCIAQCLSLHGHAGNDDVASMASSVILRMLQVRDASESPINRTQQMVWRALLQPAVAPLIRVNGTWTGKRGTPRRDEALHLAASHGHPGAIEAAARVEFHLSVLSIVSLIVKSNDLVKRDEVRCELFNGESALDDIMEVLSNAALPPYFRLPYAQLLQALIIDDASMVPALLTSKALRQLLQQVCGDVGTAARDLRGVYPNEIQAGHVPGQSPDNDSPVEPQRALPAISDAQREPDASGCNDAAARETGGGGLASTVELASLALLPCVGHLMAAFATALSIVPSKTRAQITTAINAVVDEVGLLVEALFDSQKGKDNGSTAPWASRPGVSVAQHAVKKYQQFFQTALAHDMLGEKGEPERVQRWLNLIASSDVSSKQHSTSDGGRPPMDENATVSVAPHRTSPHQLWMRVAANLVRHLEIVHTMLEDDGDSTDATLRVTSAFVLRNTSGNITFLKSLTSSVPHLPPQVAASALSVVQQCVLVEENGPYDRWSQLLHASLQHPTTATTTTTEEIAVPQHSDKVSVTCNEARQTLHKSAIVTGRRLSFDQDADSRRDVIAAFDGRTASEQLLPLITELLSSKDKTLRHQALSCAITLLDGGHRVMQEVLYESVCERSDETIFVFLRNELARLREALCMYAKAVALQRKSSTSPSKRMRLGTSVTAILGELPWWTRLLRFVQLMCEGHFLSLQDSLRVQPLNTVSVNCIESLSDVLAAIPLDAVNDQTASFVAQLLATICETIQGPSEGNQRMYAVSGMCRSLVQLVATSKHDDGPFSGRDVDATSVAFGIRWKAMECLLALLEGRTELDYLRTLASHVDARELALAMDAWYVATRKRSATFAEVVHAATKIQLEKRKMKADAVDLIVNAFIFLQVFVDLQTLVSPEGGPSSRAAVEFRDQCGIPLSAALASCECFDAVKRQVRSVEIVRRNGKLERCYFRVHGHQLRNMTKSARDKVINGVDRSSDSKRLQTFLEQAEYVMVEMDVLHRMRRNPILSLLLDADGPMDDLALVAAFAVNVVMLVFVRAENNIYDDPIPPGAHLTIAVIGVVLAVLHGMLLWNNFFVYSRISVSQSWVAWAQQQEEDGKKDDGRQQGSSTQFKDPTDAEATISKVPLLTYVLQSAFYLSQNTEFLYKILFFVSAVLGLVQSYVWYTVSLLHMIKKSPLLVNVLLAVTTNGRSLLLTLVLLVFVIYIFGAIAFYQFTELYDPDHRGTGYDCASLASCWYFHVESIRAGGGVGDIVAEPYFDAVNSIGYSFAVFKLLFYLIVMLIFLNIVLGIIVDTFAQLREHREAVEADQEGRCFICGVERNEFDRRSQGGFEHHVHSEHDMWSYILLLQHINSKEPTEFTGQEGEVFQQWLQRDISFLPIGLTMALRMHHTNVVNSSTSDSVPAELLHQQQQLIAVLSHTVRRLEDKLDAVLSSRTSAESGLPQR